MYIFEINKDIREDVLYIIDENMDDIIDLFYIFVYIFQLHIVKIFF